MSPSWLVVGSASCVWSDLAPLRERGPIVAVNQMIADCPWPITAGATLHENMAAGWARSALGAPIYCHNGADGVTHVRPWRSGWQGTSALYAVEIALALGAGRIVLAGCPMDDGPHYYGPPGESPLGPWLELYRQGWMAALPEIKGRVTSLSGWTRDLLGSPDGVW